MSDKYLSKHVHRAPNGKFYVLSQGQVVCMSNGYLRYFETEDEARAFPTQYAADDLIDQFAA